MVWEDGGGNPASYPIATDLAARIKKRAGLLRDRPVKGMKKETVSWMDYRPLLTMYFTRSTTRLE